MSFPTATCRSPGSGHTRSALDDPDSDPAPNGGPDDHDPASTAAGLPAPGEAVVHPALDGALIRHLLHPDRPLWTPLQLRTLTTTTTAELTLPLLDVLRYDERRRWWLRLALTGGVELWLLAWTPGQYTGPHDHNGAAGSFTVLTGTLAEEYRYAGGPIRSAEHIVGAGIGFGGGRAHQVRNRGPARAASVHAYSPPLRPTREYPSLAAVPAILPPPAAPAPATRADTR